MAHRPSIIRQDTTSYTPTPLGLNVKTIDFRSEATPCRHHRMHRPEVPPGKLYVDHEFPMEVACGRNVDPAVQWKRPWEFVKNPALFTDGTTRFDVGQGMVGSCWFLSVVADVAENDLMIKQLFPDDAYPIGDPSRYDGVFHVRFFVFGRWEDVYVDDFLPVWPNGTPWGAHSASEPREMWVALLEKAFARLHGSFEAISGGQASDSYQMLTGGCAEAISHKEYMADPDILHNRISNAMACGAQVTSSVQDGNEALGLIGQHTYTLVGTKQVGNTKLYRIRNPWGNTEWKGPWSDGSPEWESIPHKEFPNRDDGEFFMAMEHFMTYFDRTTVCSITPDADCDGIDDHLCYTINGFGNWRNGCDGDFRHALNNPRYGFTVPAFGMQPDGKVSLVIEIIQHVENRKTDVTDIRLDVFKILGNRENIDHRPTIVMEKKGPRDATVTYTTGLTAFYRFKLEPGEYMLIPSTLKGGQHKDFLIRTFSSEPAESLMELSQDVALLTCENEDGLKINGKRIMFSFQKAVFGEFTAGKNAGGQASFANSFHTNPQFLVTIPNTGGAELLMLNVMQARKEPQLPLGVRLFYLDDGASAPVDYQYLARHYNACPKTIEGDQHKFMAAWTVDGRWYLHPGRYLVIIFCDQPNAEKEFAVNFRCTTDIGITTYQTEGPHLETTV